MGTGGPTRPRSLRDLPPMPRHRTRRRTTLLTLAAVVLGGLGLAAPAPLGAAETTVKPIAFPVEGPVTYTDTWGAPRGDGRTHEGQDLMGKKMQRLLAAVDGIVHRITFDNARGNSVVIRGTDGWTYHYIHVNNDTPGTDDGQATRTQAFPANVVLGAPVTHGQVVAYMGDSGNAESTAPHLHFEIRQPPPPNGYTGVAINPYPSLRAAQGAPATTVSPRWDLRRTATPGQAEEQFAYGLQVGDRGLLCDWDADGTDEVVIVRAGTWHLRDGTSTGVTAGQLAFGTASDTPLCGDADGDGADEPVLFSPGGTWTVRGGFSTTDSVAWTVRYGLQAGDKPVLGDWDGDGADDLAVHRSGTWHVRSSARPSGTTATQFRYGLQAGDLPVGGDWDGDGDDDAGIFRKGQWHLRSTAAASGATASTVTFGEPAAQPVVGYGTHPARPGLGTFRPRS